MTPTVVVLQGDQTGQELLEVVAALRNVAALELTLTEIQQDRRVTLESVGLQKQAASLLVLATIISLYPLEKALPGEGRNGVGLLLGLGASE